MTAQSDRSTDLELLRRLAIQLRLWAIEARSGGWTTQHVDPMRAQAGRIEDHLGLPHASPLLEMIEGQERSPEILPASVPRTAGGPVMGRCWKGGIPIDRAWVIAAAGEETAVTASADSTTKPTPRGEPGSFAHRYDAERLKTATDWPVTAVQVARWIVTDPSGLVFDADAETRCEATGDLVKLVDAWCAREEFQEIFRATPEAVAKMRGAAVWPRATAEWWMSLAAGAFCFAVAEAIEIPPYVPVSWEDLREREAAEQTWETYRVFLFSDDARAWAEARRHRWPDGWRVYTVPARGVLREIIERLETDGGDKIDRQIAELLRERAVIDGTADPDLPPHRASEPRRVLLVFAEWVVPGGEEDSESCRHGLHAWDGLSKAEIGVFHASSMFSGWIVLGPGDGEDLDESISRGLCPRFEIRTEPTPKRQHADGQPKAPVVRTLEPADTAPEYLAYVQARTAVVQCAARLAREGSEAGREAGKAVLKIADRYLPHGGGPRDRLPELEILSYVLERDGEGWPKDEGSGIVTAEYRLSFKPPWIIARRRPLVTQYLAADGFWTDPEGLIQVPRDALHFGSATEALEYWKKTGWR